MKREIKKCLSALRARHINGLFAENAEDAASKAFDLIPPGSVVGLGDSSTVRRTGLLEKLEERNIQVLNPFKRQPPETDPEKAAEYTNTISRLATLCDVFLTGTNAITLDGRIVNVDAVGNRVAGMFWGHPVSIIIVGRNKIVRDLDEAFERIRNVIAPNHTYIKTAGFNKEKQKKPCVTTGRCGDCRSPDRACNIFTIIESKPLRTNLNVIIVNEDLGLGWDPAWPEERIRQIIENHKKFVWKARFDIFK